jgi:hypothetical protein
VEFATKVKSIWEISRVYALEHLAWLLYLLLIVAGIGIIQRRHWGKTTAICWAYWQIVAYFIIGVVGAIQAAKSSAQMIAAGQTMVGYLISLADSTVSRMLFPLLLLVALKAHWEHPSASDQECDAPPPQGQRILRGELPP